METESKPLSPILFSTVSKNVNDSINEVNSLLESSKNARNEFQAQWKSLTKDLQIDIATLESQLAQLPPSLSVYLQMSQKEGNNGKRSKKIPTSDSPSSTNSAYISLPRPQSEHICCQESHSPKIGKPTLDKARLRSKQLSPEQKRRLEQQRKFDCRVGMFNKMEEFRKHEAKMFEEMNDSGKDKSENDNDDMVRSAEIERFQRRSNQLILKIISQYKPKVTAKKAKHMNLSNFVLKDTLHGTVKKFEENSDRSRKTNQRRLSKNDIIDGHKRYIGDRSFENLQLTTSGGSLDRDAFDASNVDEVNLVTLNDDEVGIQLDDDTYRGLDFESEEEEDYNSDSFET